MFKKLFKTLSSLLAISVSVFALSACATTVDPNFKTIEFTVSDGDYQKPLTYVITYNDVDNIGVINYVGDASSSTGYMTESDVEIVREAIKNTDFGTITFDETTNGVKNPISYQLKIDSHNFTWDQNHTPRQIAGLIGLLDSYVITQ